MGLFDKKYCDICGEKIGLLGNRKLEDGNLCKDCAAKLSPFFSERRASTVARIRDQLAWRERNRALVAEFHCDRTFGEGSIRLRVDDGARRFAVCSSRDLESGNPDILSLDGVTSTEIKINERRSQIEHRDESGKMVPDDPPRTRWSYDFSVKIHVENPWFDQISVLLNRSTVTVDEPEADMAKQPDDLKKTLRSIRDFLEGAKPFDPHEDEEYLRFAAMAGEAAAALNPAKDDAPLAEEDAPLDQDIAPLKQDITPLEAPAEKTFRPKYCPNCGRKLDVPQNFCPNCGEKL
ncbi:MAG: DUF4428 domain-containing protein [Clostridia bacterium]|nr:DUF4428 domain-containing protein [Clostridia bacterium]